MAELYSAVGSHDELWAFIPDGPFKNVSDFTDVITTQVQTPGVTVYAIISNFTSKVAGCCSLARPDLPNRVIEVGLMYGASLQKTCAGTEVLYLLGKLVFNTLGYRRLEWKCDSLNMASTRAAERYGFVYEGMFRQHMIVKGRNRDSNWYSMLDSEWERCMKGFEVWLADDNFDQDGKQKRNLGQIRECLEAR